MNRRILTSLALIALAIALMAGATIAWFIDTKSVEGNVFTAGTLEIKVTGNAFDDRNMAPGDEPSEEFVTVKNTGTLDMLFKASLTNEENDGLKEALYLKVTLNPSDYESYDNLQVYGPDDEIIFNDLLSQFTGVDNVSAWINDECPLPSGYTAVYKIEVSLPFTAGDAYQGKSYRADLKFDAVQAANQDPQSIEWLNPATQGGGSCG